MACLARDRALLSGDFIKRYTQTVIEKGIDSEVDWLLYNWLHEGEAELIEEP